MPILVGLLFKSAKMRGFLESTIHLRKETIKKNLTIFDEIT